MDLLSQRYASPFLILDIYISQNRLCEFVNEFIQIICDEKEEKTMWEFYLHRMTLSDMSYNEFKEHCSEKSKAQELESQFDFAATVEQTKSMLDSFKPNSKQGGE